MEEVQVERLSKFKQKRDGAGVERALERIRQDCRDDKNVMPALVEGAEANCTLGEMVQAMGDVFGRYTSGPEW